MRTLHPKCYRDCEPSGRNAINACWRAPGKEAQPSAQNDTTSTNPSYEMQETYELERRQMQPFSRKSSRNENPVIEKKLWTHRNPASGGTLGTPWSPASSLLSLLIINYSARRHKLPCLSLCVLTLRVLLRRALLTSAHSRLSALVARSRLRRSPGERLRRSHPQGGRLSPPTPSHRTFTIKRAPSLSYYLTIPPSTR